MFFSRLFLFAFSAATALTPVWAQGAIEESALSKNEATASPVTEKDAPVEKKELVLNDTLAPDLPVPRPSIAVPPPSLPASPIPDSTPSANPADINPTLTTDTTLAQNDLWQRIRNGFSMRELNSPLIAHHEQWYAARPEYIARMMERSQRYLYFIVEEVEKRGMPTEIALLPMIESAYNPGAYSISNASGIWQFIPSTGRNFGLQQDWWYDGRRDIVNATRGALDYLQKLHDQFGDWELALAAYNWGEGAVDRALEHNRRHGLPASYISLKMPDQTRNYVPKLLAMKNIVSNPAKFGLTLQAIPNQPYFAAVATARPIDVKLAAQLAGISLEEFIALNPAHNRPVIRQENADVLLVPVDKAETFRANLESYNEPLVSWQAYRSKKGERLDQVAPRFGLSVARLKSINGLSQHAKLSNGQSLLVPLHSEESDGDLETFDTNFVPSEKPVARAATHTVKKGETLSTIARRYHVSMAKLQSWNGHVSHLKPGQTIVVAQASAPAKARHQAKAGKKNRTRLAAASKSHKKNVKLASAKGGKKQVARKGQRHVQRVAFDR